MVTLLAPVAKAPTYVKVANFPGLYRHTRSGRYYACKKLGGIRRECSLGTCDRKIAERRMKEWLGSLEKVDVEVEKTTLHQLIRRYPVVTAVSDDGIAGLVTAASVEFTQPATIRSTARARSGYLDFGSWSLRTPILINQQTVLISGKISGLRRQFVAPRRF